MYLQTWALDALVDVLAQQREEARDTGALAVAPAALALGRLLLGLGLGSLGGLPLDRRRGLRTVGDEEGARGVVVVVGLLGHAAPEVGLAEVVHVEDGLAKSREALGHAHAGTGLCRFREA